MIISIIGPTYSGKDLLATGLAKSMNERCVVFRCGQECRDYFGEEFMLNCGDPNAPLETEDYVKYRFSEMYAQSRQQSVPLIAVGNPRFLEQVNWIIQLVEDYEDTMFSLKLDVSARDQKTRMMRRDGADPKKLKFGRARIRSSQDRMILETVVNQLRELGILVFDIQPGVMEQIV